MYGLSMSGIPEEETEPRQPRAALLRQTHPVTRDLKTLENIRKVMEEDRKHLTRHPVLKHLYQRYDAIVNQVTSFGHPTSPVEPVLVFKHRINQQIVDHHNKRVILEKKLARKEAARMDKRRAKEKGKNYYGSTRK